MLRRVSWSIPVEIVLKTIVESALIHTVRKPSLVISNTSWPLIDIYSHSEFSVSNLYSASAGDISKIKDAPWGVEYPLEIILSII